MSGDKASRPPAYPSGRWPTAAYFILLMLVTGLPVANAEKKADDPAKSAAQSTMPDAYRLNLLIRTTLIALNQANQTGNYTVLRDLSAPSFQRANSAARLGEIFAALRKRNLDLSPVLFFEPKLLRPPQLNESGMLRLSGFMPSEPEHVLFDFLFEFVDSRWLLFGISIDVRAPAPPEAAALKSTPAPKKKSPQPEKGSNPKDKK